MDRGVLLNGQDNVQRVIGTLHDAVHELCERVGEVSGLAPGDLHNQLQLTPPAERWSLTGQVAPGSQPGAGASYDRPASGRDSRAAGNELGG